MILLKKVLTFTLFFMLSLPISAQTLDGNSLKNIPILHEGRIKPLDSYTRLTLREIYGKEKIDELDSNMWFIETIFAPAKSYQRKIFKINNPSALAILGLPEGQKVFNFIEMYKAFSDSKESLHSLLSTEDGDLDPNNLYIKNLYHSFTNYMGLSRSFSFLFKDFKLPTGTNYSYLDLSKDSDSKVVPELIKSYLTMVEEDATLSTLNILPNPLTGQWHTPWQEVQDKKFEHIAQWKSLYDAYLTSNQNDFNNAAKSLQESKNEFRFELETLQNKISFIQWSIALYVISFMSIFAYILTKKEFLLELSSLSIYTGAIIHVALIVFRSIILSRPPVTNLYESILFVSITSVIVSIIYYLITKKNIGLFLASSLGIVLLFLSKGYERNGDNFGMIVAVLDTNFWLATHVLTISIGYGCALVTSAMAHYNLLVYSPKEAKENKSLQNNIHLMLLFSLFFTILGTILGGIWADQSWGRFWGWDPKENGAMLICLWLLWITHAKISKHFKELSYAFFTGLTSVIVIIAWFGVNLLNVGLHSYGFSNDTALTIGIFTISEVIILGSLYIKAKRLKS